MGAADEYKGARGLDARLKHAHINKVIGDLLLVKSGGTSFNGDLSRWDVSQVTNIDDMFCNAASFNGNLSRWNVSQVTDMSHMFEGATAFSGDLSQWDISNVASMSHMFEGATSFNMDNRPRVSLRYLN